MYNLSCLSLMSQIPVGFAGETPVIGYKRLMLIRRGNKKAARYTHAAAAPSQTFPLSPFRSSAILGSVRC